MFSCKRIALIAFPVIVASIAFAVDLTERNTDYIQSLNYDLNRLLAVDLTPKSVDLAEGKSRNRGSGEVIIVTKKKHDVSSDLTENALLNPGTGVVFPGAVLKQDRTLAEGLPTPYTLPRGPLTIRVDLPGLGDKGVVTIQSPTSVAVDVEIQKIIDHWFNEAKDKEGYQSPIRAFSSSRKCYTQEQIGVELGFGAQWGKSSAKLGLDVQSDAEKTTAYSAFRQIYYTVSIEEPEEAGAVFADGVELDATNMPASQPPGFVRGVDYGRIIIVQMTTTSQITEVEAEEVLNYVTLGRKISADLEQKYRKHAQDYSFKALVLGGGKEAAELLSGDPNKIGEVISEGIEFSKSSPAYPISYTVADLKSRALSQVKTTTSYVETVREVLRDWSICLKHEGWFKAKFFVNWSEYDPKESKFVEKFYASKAQYRDWEHTLWFPGDAKNIKVKAQFSNGVKWIEKPPMHYDTPDGNKTVVISGRTWDAKLKEYKR